MSEVKPGMQAEATTMVTEDKTAPHLGSGEVTVLATPSMIALMENAAHHAIAPSLGDGQTSVGIAVNIRHLKATPRGQKVRARAEVTAVEGSRVSFSVEAWDEHQKVGEGTHERAIIDVARFEAGLHKNQ